MTYSEFKQAVVSRAARAGLTEYDLFYQASVSTTVRAYQGEIDDFSDKTAAGACFRCVVDGKAGYSHTQLLSGEEAARIVSDAAACAGVLDRGGKPVTLYEGGGEYESVPQSRETSCDVGRLREMAVTIERLALEEDPRVTSVPYAYARFGWHETGLASSKGLDLHNAQSGYTVLCEAVAEQDGRKFSGDASQDSISAEGLDLAALAKEAVRLAVGGIGGKTVPTGSYPVIFSARMMCQMLSCFSGVFSGDAAQKGLSLLSGKEGGQIAAELVSLTDDPFRAGSISKSPFDDEGVPARTKAVVERGVLKGLLYDMKSAAQAGKASTGNGRRPSYAGDVGVAPYTFCLEAGSLRFDELLAAAGKKRALYITELKGLHASANASTGDFSLESKGFLIENGKLSRPAEQFTVAGNFYAMLREITGLADDFLLEGGFGAPSTLVSSLAVSG